MTSESAISERIQGQIRLGRSQASSDLDSEYWLGAKCVIQGLLPDDLDAPSVTFDGYRVLNFFMQHSNCPCLSTLTGTVATNGMSCKLPDAFINTMVVIVKYGLGSPAASFSGGVDGAANHDSLAEGR